MALEIEDLKTKVRQAPRGKTLRRLKLKATEAMKRFDDMAKHHATFKMQLEDLSGTLGCFSSQSEGVSSADNSPRSSAAGLPSDFFGSSSSSPRSKPARQQFPPNLSSKAQQAGHATTNTKRQTQSSTQVSSAIAHPKAASPSSMHSTTARLNITALLSPKAPPVTTSRHTISKRYLMYGTQVNEFSQPLQPMGEGLPGGGSAEQDGEPAMSPSKPRPAYQSYIPPQTSVAIPDIPMLQELPEVPESPNCAVEKGNVSRLQHRQERPTGMGEVEEQPAAAPDAKNVCAETGGTDSVNLSMRANSDLPCEPKLAR